MVFTGYAYQSLGVVVVIVVVIVDVAIVDVVVIVAVLFVNVPEDCVEPYRLKPELAVVKPGSLAFWSVSRRGLAIPGVISLI